MPTRPLPTILLSLALLLALLPPHAVAAKSSASSPMNAPIITPVDAPIDALNSLLNNAPSKEAASSPASSPVSSPVSPAAVPAAVPAGSPAADLHPFVLPDGFTQDVLAKDLGPATAFAFRPDGSILIARKHGSVKVLRDGKVLEAPFIDISGEVNNYGDRGLMGIAVHPDYPAAPYVYLAYAYEPPAGASAAGDSAAGDSAAGDGAADDGAAGDGAAGDGATGDGAAGDGATGDGATGRAPSGSRTARVIRVTVDPANPDKARDNSTVVILGSNGAPDHAGDLTRGDRPPYACIGSSTPPGSNSAAGSSADSNLPGSATGSNSTDGTSTDGTSADSNSADGNSTDGNSADGNSTDGNSADGNSPGSSTGDNGEGGGGAAATTQLSPSAPAVTDCLPVDGPSHTVDGLVFGPDGALYVSAGDGTLQPDLNVRAQNLDSLAGKVLRIDPLTGLGYPDNPFYDGNPNSNRARVYAIGLRNPYRFTFAPNGDLVVGDVGGERWEEINRSGPGANFGWPCLEGPLPNSGDPACASVLSGSTPTTAAWHSYSHREGYSAAIGGDFYPAPDPATPDAAAPDPAAPDAAAPDAAPDAAAPDAAPDAAAPDAIPAGAFPAVYHGAYFFADHNRAALLYLPPGATPGDTAEVFATNVIAPVQISMGPDGALYVLSFVDGALSRIRYTGPSNSAPFPPASTPAAATGSADTNTADTADADTDTAGIDTTDAGTTDAGTTDAGTTDADTTDADTIDADTTDVDVGPAGTGTADTGTAGTTAAAPAAPTVRILTPADGSAWPADAEITLTGEATAANGDPLTGDALQWAATLHHNDHVHPDFLAAGGPTATFRFEPHAPNIHYELCLTATDPEGLTATTCVNVYESPAGASGQAAAPTEPATAEATPSSDTVSADTFTPDTATADTATADTATADTATNAPPAEDGLVESAPTSAASPSSSSAAAPAQDPPTLTAIPLDASTPHGVRRQRWLHLDGSTIAALTAAATFPTAPDTEDLLPTFDTSGYGKDYGSRLTAYLTPPTTGDYTFWLAADDSGELWLSPSADPAAAVLIAYTTTWTPKYAWDHTRTQASAPIPLVAGQRYYLEARHKQADQKDNLAVAWQPPGLPRTLIPPTALTPD